jgi:hypothetical protein
MKAEFPPRSDLIILQVGDFDEDINIKEKAYYPEEKLMLKNVGMILYSNGHYHSVFLENNQWYSLDPFPDDKITTRKRIMEIKSYTHLIKWINDENMGVYFLFYKVYRNC